MSFGNYRYSFDAADGWTCHLDKGWDVKVATSDAVTEIIDKTSDEFDKALGIMRVVAECEDFLLHCGRENVKRAYRQVLAERR